MEIKIEEFKKVEVYSPKIGYKGFNKDLVCRDNTQFEIGTVYNKENIFNPRLCSNDGYHYCNNLKDTFAFYKNDGSNRFCEIEVLGNFTDDVDTSKSITTRFIITREIPQSELKDLIEKELKEKEEKAIIEEKARIERRMNLKEVQWLQTKYPNIHVGGSVALFLHGLTLKRWSRSSSDKKPDLDIITPYFIYFESDKDFDISMDQMKSSGNDFDETFILNNVKVDVRIDNRQRYEIIEYDGFKYRVSQLEKIMEAKIKYALNGQEKHQNDVRELLGKK